MAKRTCPECRGEVSGNPRRIYCSDSCKKRAEVHRYRDRNVRTCVVCKGSFTSFSLKAIYCSTECEGEAKRWRYTTNVASHLSWHQCSTCGAWRTRRGAPCPNASDHPPPTPWTPAPAFDCRTCGQHITPMAQDMDQRRTYCSVACRDRAHRRRERERRRSVERGAYVSPVVPTEVFNRDGWRCMICRKPLKRGAAVPHPLAPTIDHIVPLADGGTHEPANVQAAHFLCNSTKGAGHLGTGEQLRLLG